MCGEICKDFEIRDSALLLLSRETLNKSSASRRF